MTPKQKALAEKHGTPREFNKACRQAYADLMINQAELLAGTAKYQREWDEAGRESKPEKKIEKDKTQRFKVEVYQQDWMPGFAAFNDDGSIKKGTAHIALNLGDLIKTVETEGVAKADLPYIIAESLMHEIIHALEAWAGVEFDEGRVQELIAKYAEAEKGIPKPSLVDMKKEYPKRGKIKINHRCKNCGVLIGAPWGGQDQPGLTGWRHIQSDGRFYYNCCIPGDKVAEPKEES